MIERIENLQEKYLSMKDIEILFPTYPYDWGEYISIIFNYIRKGFSYGDALIAIAVEEHNVKVFVTWNKKRFEGKLKVEVKTPLELIRSEI